jgi:hypothetical protein
MGQELPERARGTGKMDLPRHQIRQWPFGESRDLPRQHEGRNRRATAYQNLAALKANYVQISMASQSSGVSKQSTMKVEEITELIVQEHLLALMEKLVSEGPAR